AFFWGALCAVTIGTAGCSGDVSRFGENPSGSTYAARAPTSQAPAVPIQATRAAAVERQPLPQVQSAQPPYMPPPAASQYEQPQYAPPQPQYSSPQYPPPQPQYSPPQSPPPQPQSRPPQYPPPRYTSPQYAPPQYVPPQYAPARYAPPPYEPPPYEPPAPRGTPDFSGATRSGSNWSPPYAGAKLAHAAAPRRSPSAPVAPAPAQVATPAPTAMAGASAQTLLPAPPVHTVVSGDTLAKVAHKYRVGVNDIAVANGIAPETPLKIGMHLTVPVKTPSTRP